MREVRYRPRAALDIESAVIYVGEVLNNPAAAERLYTDLMRAIERLRETPTIGRAFLDDALEGEGYRSILVGKHRFFYTFTREELVIWRVVHTRQDIDVYELIDW